MKNRLDAENCQLLNNLLSKRNRAVTDGRQIELGAMLVKMQDHFASKRGIRFQRGESARENQVRVATLTTSKDLPFSDDDTQFTRQIKQAI